MSKVRGILALVGSVMGASKAINDLRSARGQGDKLLLANAIATVAVVCTGGAIALRDLRKELRK